MINGNLLVQRYREKISQRDHVQVYSESESISQNGPTKLGIIWELKVERKSNERCQIANRVVVCFTEEFRLALKSAGITDLEALKYGMNQGAYAHNLNETPNFAKDIERKALERAWTQ